MFLFNIAKLIFGKIRGAKIDPKSFDHVVTEVISLPIQAIALLPVLSEFGQTAKEKAQPISCGFTISKEFSESTAAPLVPVHFFEVSGRFIQ